MMVLQRLYTGYSPVFDHSGFVIQGLSPSTFKTFCVFLDLGVASVCFRHLPSPLFVRAFRLPRGSVEVEDVIFGCLSQVGAQVSWAQKHEEKGRESMRAALLRNRKSAGKVVKVRCWEVKKT